MTPVGLAFFQSEWDDTVTKVFWDTLGNVVIIAYTFVTQTLLEPIFYMSRIMRKPVFGVSDKAQHKADCTATEDGWRLEILDLESRGL